MFAKLLSVQQSARIVIANEAGGYDFMMLISPERLNSIVPPELVGQGRLTPHIACRREETVMAKGQQKSNREIKKPKAAKPAAGPASGGLMAKGQLAPIAPPKKKS